MLFDVEVQNNPPTKVALFLQCGLPRNKPSVTEAWDSHTIAFRHNSFSFDPRASITKTTTNARNMPVKTSVYRSTVRVNGRFTTGRFVGNVHLGGSPCANTGYSAGLVPTPPPA
jgi:hypothetical protein